ncbi:Probable U3 small nucleolar RNA-associated protein 11 [Galdieria sulphuraria]|uniref:U3 small nucleolar RNA-associated protein 11 n=1 Tax=Galdieria sulphuraria TaxID=130081 RepID=M2XQ20_GALSU|nr:U3 snoRNP component Utp11p-like protein [Galdieria sulphuraria]EME32317.1 U3 snoRNP component Utp11p-like protein [Galdieria sulphuraria]GJD07159.1 Probable U3 small nucleolar RNA-associated protein 11 [Galdieria sulphuraria]|eukprot:XP_005708837.1 U3 snoRNP component Utp11p-like protein [Galdieria sulphuraria]
MSSLKKYLPQKTYKERGQPRSRAKFGLLEKHKDYIERSQNYHKRERRYKALVEKALQRNPDEFYFKMISSKTENGIHVGISGKPDVMSEEESLLHLRRLCSYVVTQINHERAKIQSLRSELHFTEVPNCNRHILYVSSDSEELDRPKGTQDTTSSLSDFSSWTKGSVRKTETALKRKYAELRQRLDRLENLRKFLQSLESQKSSGKFSKKHSGNDMVINGSGTRIRERSR